MHHARLIAGFLLGLSLIGTAATYAPDGLARFYGDTTLTNLWSGSVYFNTSNETFYVGNMSSNPVAIGSSQSVSNSTGFVSLTILSNANLTVTGQVWIVTSGICTVTLPSATSGRLLSFTKRDSTNTLAIIGGTIESDTNGFATTVRWSGDVLADGTNWWIR